MINFLKKTGKVVGDIFSLIGLGVIMLFGLFALRVLCSSLWMAAFGR